jgi:hypothetical protein
VVAQVGRGLSGDRARNLHRGAPGASHPSGERLEADGGERVHVCRRARLAAVELLGRHVDGGAHQDAGASDPGQVRRGRDPEVRELRGAVLAEQHVRGLHVTVHHPVGVSVVEGVAELGRHRRHPLGLERTAPQRLRERLALHVLHDDQDALGVRRRVVDRHEVRMVQRRPEPRLAGEALLHFARARGVQPLDRHPAAQPLVVAEQDRRHAA